MKQYIKVFGNEPAYNKHSVSGAIINSIDQLLAFFFFSFYCTRLIHIEFRLVSAMVKCFIFSPLFLSSDFLSLKNNKENDAIIPYY